MTTNHINQLDDALKRPGRVDMKIPFGYADRLALQDHFLAFYLNPADDITMSVRGATYLLLHKNDPVSAVRNVTGWISQQDRHLDCETDIPAFRVADSPIRFKIYGTACYFRVNYPLVVVALFLTALRL